MSQESRRTIVSGKHTANEDSGGRKEEKKGNNAYGRIVKAEKDEETETENGAIHTKRRDGEWEGERPHNIQHDHRPQPHRKDVPHPPPTVTDTIKRNTNTNDVDDSTPTTSPPYSTPPSTAPPPTPAPCPSSSKPPPVDP